MNRTALNDARLSWKAKGIIAYMLSMPDDWTFYITELVKHATDGEASFRSGFKELKDNGYVKRFPIYNKDRTIASWETIIYEVPHGENPHVENPQVGNLHVENQGLLSTDLKLNTDKPSTDINICPPSKKENKPSKKKIADYVSMTEEEHQKLIEQFGEKGTQDRIENLNLYKGSTGKKYKSDYLTILNWERKNKGGGRTEPTKQDQYSNLF